MIDQNKCIHCEKPNCNTPPGHSEPMCQNCWAEKTEDGRQWVHEYYSREAYHNSGYDPADHPDYIDESQ